MDLIFTAKRAMDLPYGSYQVSIFSPVKSTDYWILILLALSQFAQALQPHKFDGGLATQIHHSFLQAKF